MSDNSNKPINAVHNDADCVACELQAFNAMSSRPYPSLEELIEAANPAAEAVDFAIVKRRVSGMAGDIIGPLSEMR